MNIYDKAHELARELKICPEVIEFRNSSEKVQSNDLSAKMIKNFREVQMQAYSEHMKDGKVSEETEKKVQSLAAVISMNSDVASYLQAEGKFAIIWEDIIKILNDAIGINADNNI
jgi:cell fate (sporulation/competence/biofilm development) regulator YlbF (YheA/YmcA/DUF963 family)